MRPAGLPIRETLAFVERVLPVRSIRILEVGAGTGELAYLLGRAGHRVVAVDANAEAVDAALRLGVDARCAEWPEFDEGRFDAVLFTRSLHHIGSLEAAVTGAAEALEPNGLVVVEDLAYDEATDADAEWLHGLLAVLDACNALPRERTGLAGDLLSSDDARTAWDGFYAGHSLHTAPEMDATLSVRFTVERERAPYLYRYVCPLLEESDAGYRIAGNILQTEQRLAHLGALSWVGRRFVGRRREGPSG